MRTKAQRTADAKMSTKEGAKVMAGQVQMTLIRADLKNTTDTVPALARKMGRCSGIPECCIAHWGALVKKVMKKGQARYTLFSFSDGRAYGPCPECLRLQRFVRPVTCVEVTGGSCACSPDYDSVATLASNVEAFTGNKTTLEDHHLTLEGKRAVIESILMKNAATLPHPVFGVAAIREHVGADAEVFIIDAVGEDGVTPASVVRYMADITGLKSGEAITLRAPAGRGRNHAGPALVALSNPTRRGRGKHTAPAGRHSAAEGKIKGGIRWKVRRCRP